MTPRSQLNSIRTTLVKKTINKCWGVCGQREPLGTLTGLDTSLATVEFSVEIPQKEKW